MNEETREEAAARAKRAAELLSRIGNDDTENFHKVIVGRDGGQKARADKTTREEKPPPDDGKKK